MTKQIKKLTNEQSERMPEWRDKWIAIGHNTDSVDYAQVEAAMTECYKIAELSTVPYIHVQSPIVGAYAAAIARDILCETNICEDKNVTRITDVEIKEAIAPIVGIINPSTVAAEVNIAVNEIITKVVANIPVTFDSLKAAVTCFMKDYNNLNWHYWLGGNMWSWHQSMQSFFREVCGLELSEELEKAAKYYQMYAETGHYSWPNSHFCILCDRPEELHIVNNQLHNTNGMAIRYRDGWGLYYLHGVRVPAELIETIGEDVAKWIQHENVEVRSEAAMLIGGERIVRELKGKLIHAETKQYQKPIRYELYEVELPDGKERVLKMQNPSMDGVWHWEFVEGNTVDEALLYRNGGKMPTAQQGDVLIYSENETEDFRIT